MCGQRNRNPFMVSPSYTVPELTRIYRVVGDNVHLKVRFNFICESILEKALLNIYRPDKLCA